MTNYLANFKHKHGIFLILFIFVWIFSVITISEFSIVNGTTTTMTNEVFIMYAGSLVKIFEEMVGPAFEKETSYTFVGEGKGSVQVSNLIRDGFRTPDVFVSAGTIPIIRLMNTTPTPLANWLLEFGSAEIVIAYSQNSPHYSDLEKARKGEIPWYKVVSQEGFKFGRTDPELDPKGYYGIITTELANIYYNDSSIKDRMLGEDRNPKQIFPEETLKTVLETGQLDAIIAYEHEAISRGLPYITLPDKINLSNPKFNDFYKQGNYTLKSDQRVIYGEPVFFSITIPNTVKNLDGAVSFVNFILSKNGSQLLENQGLNRINATYEGDVNKIPLAIIP
ncbi:MAG: extracellular solute-binding protein [Candidatus Nitrosocosmicus sp.]|nr:extracellular solute-binding protein [Candidatus Nitrosocosmicus sp.]MDN5867459.1 extracellular solute-binding protein [Candidatus Nitrosocosmicus sp.]